MALKKQKRFKKQHYEWLTNFLENCKNSNRSPKTIVNYRSDLEKYITWYESKNKSLLNKANANTISSYKDHLAGNAPRPAQLGPFQRLIRTVTNFFGGSGPQRTQQLAPPSAPRTMAIGSRRRHLSAIKNFYEYLKQSNQDINNLFPNNPVRPKLHGIKLKDEDIQHTRLLTCEDWNRLEKNTYALRERLSIHLLYYGGLRLEELATLRVENFDIEGYALKFTRKGGQRHTLRLQNGEEIFQLLDQYLSRRPRNSPYVFSNKSGRPLTTRAMYNAIIKAIAHAGCLTPDLSPHSFRKACATNLWSRTKDLLLVRDYLNHSDAKVTQTYIEKYNLEEESKRYL